MANPDNILSQVELAADYYPPSSYASKLTFYSNYEFELDSKSADFIPVTGAKPNPKLFVCGVLPPIANVSGKLLDRSASIPGDTGQEIVTTGAPSSSFGYKAGDYLYESGKDPIVSAVGYQIPQGTGSVTLDVRYPSSTALFTNGEVAVDKIAGFNKGTQLTTPQIWSGLAKAYQRKFGKPPTPTELQIYTAQCLRETSGRVTSNNLGMMGNHSSPTSNGGKVWGITYKKDGAPFTAYFNSYDTLDQGFDAYLAVICRSSNARVAAQQGDALGYLTSQAQNGYYGEPVTVYYNNFGQILTEVSGKMASHGVTLGSGANLPPKPPSGIAYTESIFQYRKRMEQQTGKPLTKSNLFRFMSGSSYPDDSSVPSATDPTPTPKETTLNWAGNGSANAGKAKKDTDKARTSDLNQSELGQKYQAAQYAEIAATQILLEEMASTPPLRFLVNPASFKASSEKISSDSEWGRNGPIIEHWGENQDKLDISGKVAAFFALDATNATGGPGLTRGARQYSASYQNFMSLWHLYRNNGALHLMDWGTLRNRISTLGSIYIYYDGTLYIGSFDNFNITETDTSPHTLEYNIQFSVRATFGLDSQEDPSRTYGSPQIFKSSNGTIPSKSDQKSSYTSYQDTVLRQQAEANKAASIKAAEPYKQQLDSLFVSPEDLRTK